MSKNDSLPLGLSAYSISQNVCNSLNIYEVCNVSYCILYTEQKGDSSVWNVSYPIRCLEVSIMYPIL